MDMMKAYLTGIYYTAATEEFTCTPFTATSRMMDKKPAVMDIYRKAGADKAVDEWADAVMATRMPHTSDDLRRLTSETHRLARADMRAFRRNHFAWGF